MVPLLLLPLLWGGSLQEMAGYRLEVQESVAVKACMDVRVTCSFSYPWNSGYPWYYSAELFTYWFREKDQHTNDAVATNDPSKRVKPETRGRFSLLGDPSNNDCSLSIRQARLSDSGVYYFRVERGHDVRYSYKDKKLNLQVTGKPDIHFLEPLVSGRPTKLTCTLSLACEEPHPLLFSWAGDALDAMKPDTLHSSELTLTPRPQDHGTNLTCRVTFQQVTLERTVLLNVSYIPRNLHISLSFKNVTAFKILQNTSSILISEGQELQLLCVADSNPPAQLSWFRGSPALEATPISSTGVLELPCVGAAEEGEFTCRAQNPLGFQNIFLSLIVVCECGVSWGQDAGVPGRGGVPLIPPISPTAPPQLLGPSCSQEDESLRCSCSSRARPAPSLHWRLGKGLLEGNFSNASFEVSSSSAGPWANGSLSLRVGLSSGVSLSCEALNIHGARSGSVLLLPGKPALLVAGALGGAGAMALLSLCLCLLFFYILKARRKQAAMRPEGVDDEDPVMGTVAWGSRQKPCSDSPPDQMVLSPAEDAPPPGEQEDLHYASLNFHEMISRKPQDQEATSTEYSEIKTS
ncbi:sialic acid-binding Ig-like lectin 5 isoform X2 [Bos javanicus]|uniref:sialic acid-binding Ig-like lectin 5 isoform X2 n=1 Tax=Bos javanicus TaxID=9906 RepID=UPI002AA74708|nr:sialic acid-binding Ig-like lectin 5 isoform X2 [Bos javanicus]